MAQLVKITAQKASDILKHFELSEDAVEFTEKVARELVRRARDA